MAIEEPPRPQRGATAEERGRDVSIEQQELEDAGTRAERLGAAASPKFLLSQAEGYPPGIKQFLQVCLILIYPAWLVVVLIAWPLWVVGKAGEWVLYALFWPIRARHKKNNPEEYAAFEAEQRAKKDAAKAARARRKQAS